MISSVEGLCRNQRSADSITLMSIFRVHSRPPSISMGVPTYSIASAQIRLPKKFSGIPKHGGGMKLAVDAGIAIGIICRVLTTFLFE